MMATIITHKSSTVFVLRLRLLSSLSAVTEERDDDEQISAFVKIVSNRMWHRHEIPQKSRRFVHTRHFWCHLRHFT